MNALTARFAETKASRDCWLGCQTHLLSEETNVAHIIDIPLLYSATGVSLAVSRGMLTRYVTGVSALPQLEAELIGSHPKLSGTSRVALLHGNEEQRGVLRLPEWWYVAAVEIGEVWHRNVATMRFFTEVKVAY